MLDNEETEHKEVSDGELTKSKVKKPRTPAQQEAFKEVMRKRQENIQLRKDEKIISSAKLLVAKNIMPVPASMRETPKAYKAKKTVYQPEPEPESESEEEIIIIKSKPKPKKKTKKIIVEDSSSEDNSSGSSGGGGRQKHRPIVQVQRATIERPINYFI